MRMGTECRAAFVRLRSQVMLEDIRPPVNRCMPFLDRSLFCKELPISAARIFSRQDLDPLYLDFKRSKDILPLLGLPIIRPDPDGERAQAGAKCILLKPCVKHDNPETWSTELKQKVTGRKAEIIPYNLKLSYDNWTYHDIVSSILPEGFPDEDIPTRFSIAGHVAHLNLRGPALPYRFIIAEVLVDKNPIIKTVINKLDDVGKENPFRTFPYEVLAGDDDMDVTVKEGGCMFHFDFSKVYWNTRLQAEHLRLINLFKPGVAVCDVMAGVGPFAAPAGKKSVFVWANDLNPESYKYLCEAIARNKVSMFVRPFNQDGRTFIKSATERLWRGDSAPNVPCLGVNGKLKETTKYDRNKVSGPQDPKRDVNMSPRVPMKNWTEPRFFSHYVMNLPASALTFLPSFIGLYSSFSTEDQPDWPLPMVHVYTFALKPAKDEDNAAEIARVCSDISKLLGSEIKSTDPEVHVHNVRDVAPKKLMFCVSFRLPAEVAWRRPVPNDDLETNTSQLEDVGFQNRSVVC